MGAGFQIGRSVSRIARAIGHVIEELQQLLQLPVSRQATSSAARACSVVLLARIGTAVAGLIIVAIVTGIGLTLLALVGDVLVDWMWFSAIGYAQVFSTTMSRSARRPAGSTTSS
jgi:hypothetical protein